MINGYETSPPLPWCGWVGDEKTRATHFTCPLIRDLCLFGLAWKYCTISIPPFVSLLHVLP